VPPEAHALVSVEPTLRLEPEGAAQEDVVADLDVAVQRKVRAVERGPALDQGRDTPKQSPRERSRPAPEQAVVDDDEIGSVFHGGAQRPLGGIHGRRDVTHVTASPHLEAVECLRIVRMPSRSKVSVEILEQGF
jgi:hypothetical protein